MLQEAKVSLSFHVPVMKCIKGACISLTDGFFTGCRLLGYNKLIVNLMKQMLEKQKIVLECLATNLQAVSFQNTDQNLGNLPI